MKVTGKYLIENDLFELAPGYEIDPEKEYWYDPFTGHLHEPLSLFQQLWHATPWMRWRNRRQWEQNERERRAILDWELSQLPEGFTERQGGEPLPTETFGKCLQIVAGRDFFSNDAGYLEMAADTICSLLVEYPTAEKAFRNWFGTRYADYDFMAAAE
jgi:hypothetical protein